MKPSSRTCADADDRLRPAGKYPAPVLAAAVLTAEGVSFLLVGSAALWLHAEPITVADADVVIEPGERNLRRLSAALAQLALRPRTVPPVRAFAFLQLAYREGSRPPLRPQAVIEALRQVIQRPGVTSEELIDIVRPPCYLNGCTVSGDFAALTAGRPAVLRLQAGVTISDDQGRVSIKNFRRTPIPTTPLSASPRGRAGDPGHRGIPAWTDPRACRCATCKTSHRPGWALTCSSVSRSPVPPSSSETSSGPLRRLHDQPHCPGERHPQSASPPLRRGPWSASNAR